MNRPEKRPLVRRDCRLTKYCCHFDPAFKSSISHSMRPARKKNRKPYRPVKPSIPVKIKALWLQDTFCSSIFDIFWGNKTFFFLNLTFSGTIKQKSLTIYTEMSQINTIKKKKVSCKDNLSTFSFKTSLLTCCSSRQCSH